MKKITIGMILTLISALVFLAWATSAIFHVSANPTNPNVLAEVAGQGAQKIAEESAPTIISIILSIVLIFGGGIFSALLIILAVGYWGRIENFDLSPFIDSIFNFSNEEEVSL